MSQGGRLSSSHFVFALMCAAMVLLFFVSALMRLPVPDVAMQLYLAGETLDGAKYGRDILEINPPLFAWIAAPALALARYTGASPWTAFVMCLFGFHVWVSVLVLRLCDAGRRSSMSGKHAIAWASLLAVVFPLDFGQREHFIVVLLTPYILLAAKRVSGAGISRAMAAACGALAAIAVALKPHYGVVLLFVELRIFWLRGFLATVRRVEPWLIVAFSLLYLIAIGIAAPDYYEFLQSHAGQYRSYSSETFLRTLLLARLQFLILLGLLAWLLAKAHAPHENAEPAAFLMLAMLGSLAAVVIQGKGFSYHYLPAQVFALLLLLSIAINSTSAAPSTSLTGARRTALVISHALVLAWYVVDVADAFVADDEFVAVRLARVIVVPLFLLTTGTITGEHLRKGRLHAASLGAAVVVVLMLATHTVRSSSGGMQPGIDRHLHQLLEVIEGHSGQNVAVLSTDPASAWPLILLSGAKWPLRYPSLGFLAAFYPRDTAYQVLSPPRQLWERSIAEQQFLTVVVEDLVRTQPALLIALAPDTAPSTLLGRVARHDFIAYLSTDSRFAAMMDAYDEPRTIGLYLIYERSRPQP